jgi:hypothetical protein
MNEFRYHIVEAETQPEAASLVNALTVAYPSLPIYIGFRQGKYFVENGPASVGRWDPKKCKVVTVYDEFSHEEALNIRTFARGFQAAWRVMETLQEQEKKKKTSKKKTKGAK